jgi:hypothetical protein
MCPAAREADFCPPLEEGVVNGLSNKVGRGRVPTTASAQCSLEVQPDHVPMLPADLVLPDQFRSDGPLRSSSGHDHGGQGYLGGQDDHGGQDSNFNTASLGSEGLAARHMQGDPAPEDAEEHAGPLVDNFELDDEEEDETQV